MIGRNEFRATALGTGGAIALVAPSTAPAAEQVPIPLTTSERSGPAAGNAMTADYGSWRAYGLMSGLAIVNAHNRHAAFAEAPEPGLLGGTDASEVELVQ